VRQLLERLGERAYEVVVVEIQAGDHGRLCGAEVAADSMPRAFVAGGPKPTDPMLPLTAVRSLVERDQGLTLVARHALRRARRLVKARRFARRIGRVLRSKEHAIVLHRIIGVGVAGDPAPVDILGRRPALAADLDSDLSYRRDVPDSVRRSDRPTRAGPNEQRLALPREPWRARNPEFHTNPSAESVGKQVEKALRVVRKGSVRFAKKKDHRQQGRSHGCSSEPHSWRLAAGWSRSLRDWSRRSDLNRGPADYESLFGVQHETP
jgi:hypothetical protein